ncbi:hypothetical protein [Pedobacter nototheniae]|uniref:hypothetical protein n=1 Tax=Pedobacter nototheniae TaxID=2488994 RepID=UPI00292E11F4|nr:hypothetical protein [Pedobacter nototheniae]
MKEHFKQKQTLSRGRFIKQSGVALLLIPFGNVFANFTGLENDKDLKAKCILAFNRFSEIWNFNDFWKRGNTFDACLNFVDALMVRFPNDPEVKAIAQKVNVMLKENLAYFKGFNPDKLWADDFGWWGLMGLNANKHLLKSGNTELANEFLDLSSNLCWDYQRKKAYDFSNSGMPVTHGCSNGDAAGENKGVKNTVTNVLFFLLSIRNYKQAKTAQMADRDKYMEMIYKQWLWFDSWFKLEKYQYLKKISNNAGLVQERPMAIVSGSTYTNITHPTWEEGWLWTGDQGMVLAALCDLRSIKKDIYTWVTENKIDDKFKMTSFESSIENYILLIAKGIEQGLVGENDGVIREAPFTANFGAEFGNDYLAGRGIMMRYLGALDKKIIKTDFYKSIKNTVEAIWAHRDLHNNQFTPEFTAVEEDKNYNKKFKSQFKSGDNVIKWDIEKMDKGQKAGVCQSIGMDALGALLRLK